MSTKEKNQYTIKYNTDIKQWVAFCINPTDVRLAISLLFCFYLNIFIGINSGGVYERYLFQNKR